MRLSVLASGSKGNCTYFGYNDHHYLIDIGITTKQLELKLGKNQVCISQIEGIFITHTHVDHIAGLKSFIKKNKCRIYLTEKMYKELNFDYDNYVYMDDDFKIDEMSVKIIKTSHDVEDSNGYVFESDGSSFAYITDTGYLNEKYFPLLKNRGAYVMESNHDVEMILNGKYPYFLQQRIIGPKGHLSNKDSAYYLSKLIGTNTNNIILIHLSEDNNTEDKAKETLLSTLNKYDIAPCNIIISTQNEETELIKI